MRETFDWLFRQCSIIDDKTFDNGDTAKTADDFLSKINQDVDNELDTLSQEIKAELVLAVGSMQVKLQDEYQIAVPKIPLDAILDRLKKESVKSVTVTVKREDFFGKLLRILSLGRAGKETKQEQRFDATHYFQSTRSEVKIELMKKKIDYIDSVKEQVELACNNYKASVTTKIQQQQALIDKLKEDQWDNNSLKTAHQNEVSKVNDAMDAIGRCITMQNLL